ncbi:HdeD family acid-resistance protein [Nitratifractor sp.]
MLDFKVFSNQPEMLEKFSKYAKIYGVIFLILGLVGIFFPGLMSITTAIFFGWLLLFSGFMVGVQTWQINRKDWIGWLKFLLFTVTGAMIIINPLPGVIALGIIFAAYFFVDAFANVALAFRLRPEPYWWVALLNGVLSLALGIFFFMAIGNPLQTLWLVGILVGISLFFDGIMLLSLSSAAKQKKENQ